MRWVCQYEASGQELRYVSERHSPDRCGRYSDADKGLRRLPLESSTKWRGMAEDLKKTCVYIWSVLYVGARIAAAFLEVLW